MNADEKYGDVLLAYWGRWARNRIVSGHGYSSESIEYKLMRDGLVIASQRNDVEPDDDLAESLDSIIVRMPKKMKKVVKVEYLVYASRKHKQEICHLGRRRYEDFLKRGRNWVVMEYEQCNIFALA